MAAIVVAVAVAKSLNPSIGFANGSDCDPWYFTGIYEDYFGLYRLFPGHYQFFRYPALLPWIYVAPHLSSIAFHDLKFWTYLLLTSGCFASASIALLGNRVGALIAILFSCSTLVLGTLSSDFVTGAGLMWECAIIAATVYGASRDKQLPWAIATGVLYACCVFTHLPTVMFAFPLPLLFFAESKRPRPILSFIRFNAWGLAGFIAATALMALYSVAIGNPPAFFWAELIAATHSLDADFYQRPITNTWDWFKSDTNIPVLLAAVAVSIVGLARVAIWRGDQWWLWPAPVAFLLVAAPCFTWELTGHFVLQQNVFAPWMLPTAFLAIGAGLAMAPPMRSIAALPICVIAAAALSVMAIRANPGIPFEARFAVAALVVLLCAAAFWRHSGALIAVASLVLICVTYPTGYGLTPWFIYRVPAWPAYESTHAAHAFVETYAQGERPTFWISGDVGAAAIHAIAAVSTPRSFLQCSDFAASFPAVARKMSGWDHWLPDLKTESASGYIKPGKRLFVIAKGSDLMRAAAEPLASVGLVGKLVAERVIDEDVSIAAFDLSAAPE